MAEFALPILAIGGFYVIANHEKSNKEKENFENKESLVENVPLNETVRRNISLTGETIQVNDFKHNNMVPFFGSKGGGKSVRDELAESRLDYMQGGGSQNFHKREIAPLFKPTDNAQLSYGMPNQSNFIQSRMNESNRMANVKPWDEQRVAPGLNKGYTTSGSQGFNSGMEAREAVMPRTVDELRVTTNPKTSYGLKGHEGPANYHNKVSGSVKTHGRFEKHNPEREHELGPSRWFTTTGAVKGTTARENYTLEETERQLSTSEYFGTSRSEVDGSYTKRNFEESTKQQFKATDIPVPSASGRHDTKDWEYSRNGYNILSNNRTIDGRKNEFGQVMGMVRATIAPFQDVFRPSRKELLINNLYASGNPGAEVAKTQLPKQDNAKPTIRQMTESGQYGKYLNYQGDQNEGGYLSTGVQPTPLQRDSTNIAYKGNVNTSVWNAPQTYTAARNQRNNNIKTIPNRPNPGGLRVFQNKVNVETQKLEKDRRYQSVLMPTRGHNAIPTKKTLGETYQPPVQRENDRISEDLLTAFKKNPYTKSLHSY